MKKVLSIVLLISVLLSSLTFTAFAADEIVYTTADSQFSTTGAWKESTNEKVAGPTGGTSWYSTDKNATSTFDASELDKGTYGVYYYMTPYGTTSDKADITITASGKSITFVTDGFHGGSGNRHWIFLGKYDFDGSSEDSVVQAHNENAELIGGTASTGCIRASAVKFVKNDTNSAKPDVISEKGKEVIEPEVPVEITYSTVPEKGNITIGTAHPGFSKKGNWKESSLAMPADGSAYYSSTVGSSAIWYPYINKADNVEVFYLKPNATNTEDPALEIEVFASGETEKFVIDFTQPPTDWFSLGRYNFSGDGSEYIKINKVSPTGTARITCLKFEIEAEEVEDVTSSAFFGTDLHILERMGMLIGEGDGITEEYIKTVPTRVQAAIMVLRLNGVDAEAAAFTGTDNFADSSLEAWAMPYLAYLKAHPEFGLIGTGDNMFEPTVEIDAQAYAKILLTALGYEYNVDFTWDETIAFAKEKGIAVTEGIFDVKGLAEMTVSALNLNCKNGTPFLEKLIAERDGVQDEGVFGIELTPELKAQRDIARKKKRFIYNNDGNDVYKSYPEYPGAFDISNLDEKTINTENFLKERSYGLEDTQVTSVFYCTGVFNSYTHESSGITDTRVRDWSRVLKEYTGKDSLETMVDYVHSLDKEIFWSMRMNDTHDYKYEENELDPWKQANMDLLMFRKKQAILEMPYGSGRWTSVDYTLTPVRQVVYDILKDTLTRYDIDGLELDLTRWPVFFKEVTQGYEVYPENVERMNNLIRMIRDLTEKISIERGKPILLAIYVPDSIDFCYDVGLDVKKWINEGLIDIVSLSYIDGAFQDWDDAIGEYEGLDAQVFAAVDSLAYVDSDMDDLEINRNEAALAYAAGADGIYTYNYFNINYELFDILGSPETCGPVDPSYVTKRKPYNAKITKDGEKYVTISK